MDKDDTRIVHDQDRAGLDEEGIPACGLKSLDSRNRPCGSKKDRGRAHVMFGLNIDSNRH
jgi:hypothetical protein